MGNDTMGKTVRLSDAETELLRQKAIEINKLLVKAGHPPMRDSELLHKILDKSLPYVQLGKDGQIVIEAQ